MRHHGVWTLNNYLYLHHEGCQCSLQLLVHFWICARGTHYSWVNQGSVEYSNCHTSIHTTMQLWESNPRNSESNALPTCSNKSEGTIAVSIVIVTAHRQGIIVPSLVSVDLRVLCCLMTPGPSKDIGITYAHTYCYAGSDIRQHVKLAVNLVVTLIFLRGYVARYGRCKIIGNEKLQSMTSILPYVHRYILSKVVDVSDPLTLMT